MQNDKYFSSLNVLLDNVEGTNLLLEYYADFSKRLFKARDFKSVLSSFYKELKKIYVNQNIEFVLWQNHQQPVKFIYNESTKRVSPIEEFSDNNTLYNYVMEQQQVVLTNNYAKFCDNLGVWDGQLPASSWLGIPMIVRGKVLGMVAIWDKNAERYLRLQDKQFLLAVTNMASFAMENIYLYDYIVEKNGSYKIFDTVLPKGMQKNSIKNVILHLLEAVLQQHDSQYSAVFLRSQYHNKWRLLSEKYNDSNLKRFGLDLLTGLYNVHDSLFEGTEYLHWHSDYATHALNPVFKDVTGKFPLNSTIVFPFVVERSYYGLWVIGFNRNGEQPTNEEVQLYRFISYLLFQLIEKKALLERKNKYESYLKHLEKMKTVGEMASGSAHHLNNILSVIIGKTQILQKKLKDSPHLRDLQMIEKAADDGANAVRRLQNVNPGNEKLSKEILNINDLVQEVIEIARPRFEGEAQTKNIAYDLKLNLGRTYQVQGNAPALREVLLNLINNGLDAMPNGGQLSIQTTIKEDDVLIFVSDTGNGIPEDVREKIFEPFFSTKGEKGNGLGLSIAADIISKHNGKIYVDSIPQKGSIMMIELPGATNKEMLPAKAPYHASKVAYKVLIVDDEGLVRETLAEILEDEGCEVTVAKNAEDAILKFQKYQCDVVLTDLSMPGINGYELARRIKEMNIKVPVFLITGWNQLDRKFMQSNKVIDGIIEKPFNVEQIKDQITKIIEKYGPVKAPVEFHYS